MNNYGAAEFKANVSFARALLWCMRLPRLLANTLTGVQPLQEDDRQRHAHPRALAGAGTPASVQTPVHALDMVALPAQP